MEDKMAAVLDDVIPGRKISDREIKEYIARNRREMIDELKAWVSHPSVSRADLGKPGAPFGPDCRAMLDFALQRGRDLGFRTAIHGGYCGDILYGEEEEELGFVSHLDVVPEGEGWIFEPYRPTEKDGWLIARGVSDNKGSAILAIWAFRFFREKQIPLKKTLRLMLGCAEETGMDDYRHYLNDLHGKVPELSIVADAAFPVCYAQKGGWNAELVIPAGVDIAEFTAGKVSNSIPDRAELVIRGISAAETKEALGAYPETEIEILEEEISGQKPGSKGPGDAGVKEAGEKAVRIISHGKAGHAAFPEGSRNAITLLARAVTGSGLGDIADVSGIGLISELFSSYYGEGIGLDLEDEASGKLTVNADVITLQEDGLHLQIDVRFPVSVSAKWVGQAFRKRLDGTGARLEHITSANPYYIDPESRIVKTLTSIYQEVTGRTEQPYAMGGGTYSRVIPNGISFGPGFPSAEKPPFLPAGHGNAHGPDEALNIERWLAALEVYIQVISALTAGRP